MTVPDLTFGPKGWTPERLGSLAGKTFVITGGNAGAGFQASRILLSKGAKVMMLNRSVERSTTAVANLKGEFGATADVSFIQMDLSDLSSVRQAAQQAREKFSPDRRIDLQCSHRASATAKTDR